MAREPRSRDLGGLVASRDGGPGLAVAHRQVQLDGAPGGRHAGDLVGRSALGLWIEAVEPIALPVELFLQRDHLLQVGQVGGAPRVEARAQLGGGAPAVAGEHRLDRALGASTGYAVELARPWDDSGVAVRDREQLQLGRVELVALHPCLGLEASSDASRCLGVEHLLHPEAGRRRVEQPQQRQMLVLRRPGRQLDRRRRAIE
jgi:hypothetical protein